MRTRYITSEKKRYWLFTCLVSRTLSPEAVFAIRATRNLGIWSVIMRRQTTTLILFNEGSSDLTFYITDISVSKYALHAILFELENVMNDQPSTYYVENKISFEPLITNCFLTARTDERYQVTNKLTHLQQLHPRTEQRDCRNWVGNPCWNRNWKIQFNQFLRMMTSMRKSYWRSKSHCLTADWDQDKIHLGLRQTEPPRLNYLDSLSRISAFLKKKKSWKKAAKKWLLHWQIQISNFLSTIPAAWSRTSRRVCRTKFKGRIYKTTIRRMEGRIYISVIIGDTCSHHRICSPDRCFVDTPFQLCTAGVSYRPARRNKDSRKSALMKHICRTKRNWRISKMTICTTGSLISPSRGREHAVLLIVVLDIRQFCFVRQTAVLYDSQKGRVSPWQTIWKRDLM